MKLSCHLTHVISINRYLHIKPESPGERKDSDVKNIQVSACCPISRDVTVSLISWYDDKSVWISLRT